MSCRCLVRGSINIDEYFYVRTIVRPGETASSREYKRRIGGKGANQAVAIARAGGEVDFYGTVGKDGEWLVTEMEKLGMNVEGIIVSSADPTGRALIQVADNGENSIVLFPGSNYSQLKEDRILKDIDGLCHINATHLLLQNEIDMNSTQYALEHALGLITIFNPSPLPLPDQVGAFPWHKIDWLILNAGEAEGLYRAATGQEARTWVNEDEILRALSSLPLFNRTNIICTLGARGAVAAVRTASEAPASFLYVPAAKLHGALRDTTGAGDCFTGYFVRGLMKLGPDTRVGRGLTEKDVENILKAAMQAAGISVERPGTIDSIPFAHEVEGRMGSIDSEETRD